MKAEIIAVGSELLTPDRLDTNSLFLTEELNAIGIEVVRKTVVGDSRDLLAEAFRDALNRVPLIISSGGLGPTEDDLTRETVAELLGRKLRRNDEILRYIEGRFRSLGREMPEVNVRQAMVPEGAEILENSRGTAPGLWLEDSGRAVVLLPGPPRAKAAVSRAGFAASRAARFRRALVQPRAARHRAWRIARGAAHPGDLQTLSGSADHDSRGAGRNADSSAFLDRGRGTRKEDPG
jgi:molybdenum cofactor synthesis domain-containing protein